MTNIDKYDIMIQRIEKEWHTMQRNNIPHTSWEKPIYSKKQIDKAGKILSKSNTTEHEVVNALSILNNWRAAHAYPLHIVAKKLRNDNPNAIVVQRLKRLESIVGKLQRFPEMSLYRMQDLGGCRVIVDKIQDVYNSLNHYKTSKVRHILKRENDYIQNPKASGYRGYHAVYQFHSDTKDTYNKNMLIEIQFRTKLQHLWATAVEIMGIYTKTALKSSIGNKDILRFFTLVSSAFAIVEETPTCPNTPTDILIILKEISEIDAKLNILAKLDAMSTTIRTADTEEKAKVKSGYYILMLNYTTRTLRILPYYQSQLELATQVYNKIEQKHYINLDVVLVSATSLDTLKTAYPNYFTDIGQFIQMLQKLYQGQ